MKEKVPIIYNDYFNPLDIAIGPYTTYHDLIYDYNWSESYFNPTIISQLINQCSNTIEFHIKQDYNTTPSFTIRDHTLIDCVGETCFIPSKLNNINIISIGDTACSYYDPDENIYCGNNSSELFIQNGVETIESDAFTAWRNLQVVFLPPSIKRIDKFCFCYCNHIKDVYIYNNSNMLIHNKAFSYLPRFITYKLKNNDPEYRLGYTLQDSEL